MCSLNNATNVKVWNNIFEASVVVFSVPFDVLSVRRVLRGTMVERTKYCCWH